MSRAARRRGGIVCLDPFSGPSFVAMFVVGALVAVRTRHLSPVPTANRPPPLCSRADG